MTDKFTPRGLATVIGSFPHTDPREACDLVFRYLPEAPAWPQLPRRDLREGMCPQYSAGMPGLVTDLEKERIYFRTDGDFLAQLESFYQKVIEDDLDYFGLTADYASGFQYFLAEAERKGGAFPFLKGQVTGAITFGLTITDRERKPSLYHPELADAITKTLTLKARWQIKKLSPFCRQVIIFIDEPYLSSIGSAVVSLREAEVVSRLDEVISGIHQEGGIAGVHCCANTDWSILLKTGVDILSFDAYGYAKNLLLYARPLEQFFSRGGFLAWGVVPSSKEAEGETVDALSARIEGYFGKLAVEGIPAETVRERSLITPSCGLGTLTVELAERILGLTRGVSEKVRSRK